MSRQTTTDRPARAGGDNDDDAGTGAAKPVMKVFGGSGQNPDVVLDRPISIVGRSGMHVSLDARTVSRCHALIVVDPAGGGAYVRDLASRNGISVNGTEVRESPLADRSTLRVGAFTLRCESGFSPGGVAAGEPDAPAAPAAHFVVLGHDVPIPPGQRTVLIGTRDGCDIELDDPNVTSTHAVIAEMGAARHIRDLGSEHGTYVNGKRVRQRELRDGDEVLVGDTTMRYAYGAAAAAAAGADAGAEPGAEPLEPGAPTADADMPWDEILGPGDADADAGADAEADVASATAPPTSADDEALAAAIAAEVLGKDAAADGAPAAPKLGAGPEAQPDGGSVPTATDAAGPGIAARADALSESADDLLAAEREAAVQEAYELAAIDSVAPAVEKPGGAGAEADDDTDEAIEVDGAAPAEAAGKPRDVAEAAPVPPPLAPPPPPESDDQAAHLPRPSKRSYRSLRDASHDDDGEDAADVAEGPRPIDELADVEFEFGSTALESNAERLSRRTDIEAHEADETPEADDEALSALSEPDDRTTPAAAAERAVRLAPPGEVEDISPPAPAPAATPPPAPVDEAETKAQRPAIDVPPAIPAAAAAAAGEVKPPAAAFGEPAANPAPEPPRQAPAARPHAMFAQPHAGSLIGRPSPVLGTNMPPGNLPIPVRPPLGGRRRRPGRGAPGVVPPIGPIPAGAFADSGLIQSDVFGPDVPPAPPQVPAAPAGEAPRDHGRQADAAHEPEILDAKAESFEGEVVVAVARPAPAPAAPAAPAEPSTEPRREPAARAPAAPPAPGAAGARTAAIYDAPLVTTPEGAPDGAVVSAPPAACAPARPSRKARRRLVRRLEKQIRTLTERVAALEASLAQRAPQEKSNPEPASGAKARS